MLNAEKYIELKIEPDVYNLKVDDKVQVSRDGKKWFNRHFNCIHKEVVITWALGKTSFSAINADNVATWRYARIPRRSD